ncbi:MAG: glycoside hydrolase family 3 N-terminal domain-containing protein [Pseudomonadota bacterium]
MICLPTVSGAACARSARLSVAMAIAAIGLAHPALAEASNPAAAGLEQPVPYPKPLPFRLGNPPGGADEATREKAKAASAKARADRELRRMIGQMLLVGFHGQSKGSAYVQRLLGEIRTGDVGGVILMERNIDRAPQIKRLVDLIKQAAAKQPPLLIGIDQEGGAVQRLRSRQGVRRFSSAWMLARGGDINKARQTYESIAKDLARRGINLNFGPVVDLRINQRNPIIARMNRSYGRNAENVAAFARIFIDAHRKYGILTCAKHFPGHGSSLSDSHKGFVDITKTWKEVELEPYTLLRGTGHLEMVMTGHLYHERLSDEGRWPATLSRAAIDGLLRSQVGYRGAVITDDLSMGAIRRNHTVKEAVVRSVLAGNDILLMSSPARSGETISKTIREILIAAVADGTIPRSRIAASYHRIRELKRGLALNSLRPTKPSAPIASGAKPEPAPQPERNPRNPG